ncbi:Nucleotide-binding universal stress protein, UspA family [Polaribacter sp. KT25b]|uniref:universal stress protein n=1 Tax=Polaribacter sp. KT25b TaxID=1855336 RepID=UPI00087A5D8C|nr:universal stress protein [Polaribacter sp. KT25b]SDR67151.1 Nucleotide-binding universal stress protein, UspA family [Polaribacter sp. KT25b]
MKNILVLTDFSKNAYCALFYAAKLFEKEPAHLIILNSFEAEVSRHSSVIDLDISQVNIDKLFHKSEATCLAIKCKLIKELKSTKHTFKIIATSLLLTRAINEFIESENVDFVVMGSKGKTATERIFVGSNSFRAIQTIKKVPILIIPDEIDYKEPKKIGFASSFKRSYTNEQLVPLKEISKLFNSKTTIIYVYEHEKLNAKKLANLENLLEISKDENIELNWLPKRQSKADTIMEYVYKEQLCMLTFCYYKHNFISDLFRENVVKEITYHIRNPLLILPNFN